MKTLTVDDRHRVTIPEAEPGQVFAYEPGADGTIKLVPVVTERRFAPTTLRRDWNGVRYGLKEVSAFIGIRT
jgi:hypothetical protein